MRNKALKILFASVFVLMASFAFNSKGNFTNEQTSLTDNDNVSLVNENKQLLNNTRKEETTETKTIKKSEISSYRNYYGGNTFNNVNNSYCYLVGETFNPSDIKIEVTYSDNTIENISDKVVWNIDTNTPLTSDVKYIGFTYEEYDYSSHINVKMIESFSDTIVKQAYDDILQQFAAVRDDSNANYNPSTGVTEITDKIVYFSQLLALYNEEERKDETVASYFYKLNLVDIDNLVLAYWINDFRKDNAPYGKDKGGVCGLLSKDSDAPYYLENMYFNTFPELGFTEFNEDDNSYGALAIMDITYDTTGEDGSIITVGQTLRYLANAYRLIRDEEATSNEIALATSNVMSPVMQTVVFVGALILVSLVGFVAIDSAKSKKKGNK